MGRQVTGGGQARASLMPSFGDRLKDARERVGLTQEGLAADIGVTRVTIANYERGKGGPEPDRAVKLAKVLDENEREFLLLSLLQGSTPGGVADEDLRKVVSDLLGGAAPSQTAPESLPGYLSLVDFPSGFEGPWVVIVGDRREPVPQNKGDLFVFSASPCDDRWLLALGLPPDTEKISDKVLTTASLEWLKERLGRTHILCIGSPASNLYAREHNACFLFSFAITRWTWEGWIERQREIAGLNTPAALLGFSDQQRSHLRQTMRMFKPSGFVDFNYPFLTLGMDPRHNRDFAVVSLGRNPYAEPGARYFSVLAAGVHHPGTAHSVRHLADRSQFQKHPFGGILEVQVPDDATPDAEKVLWHERIDKSRAHWHTAGDGLEYGPEELRGQLQKWLEEIDRGIPTDVHITKEELEGHLQLLDLLKTDTDHAAGGQQADAS